MIKYENRIKMNEIRRLIGENQYIQAGQIVDTLELTKIKSVTDLSVIADVLIQNERFDDALQVLSKVYAKTKTRRILYQLVDLSIRSKNIEQAEKFLLQYMKVAPQDPCRFIFRYSIDKLKDEPFEVLIESLEELKEYDYIEKWAYELAKLYHKAGNKDKCVCECSDIILWFGDGIYVEKAKLLKGYYVGDIDPIRMLKATEKKVAEPYIIDEVHETANEEVHETVNEINEEVHEIANEVNEEVHETVNEINEEVHEIAKDTYDITEEIYAMPEDVFIEDKTVVSFDEKLDLIFNQTNLDYHKLFGYFIHSQVCRNEIANFLNSITINNGKQIHLILCGNKRSGKTTLAKEIAKALYGLGQLPSSKVAKISAYKINNIDLDDNYHKLMDCTLLIEEAGSLDLNGIEQLLHFMWSMEGHTFVILEDTLDRMNKLLRSNANLEEKFEYRINLPILTEEDLFHYANHYIVENDYQLTNEAEGLLKNRIDEIVKSEKAEDRLEVIMKMVKEVKLRADKRNKEELIRIIGSQKLSETDFLYINVEDFECDKGEE